MHYVLLTITFFQLFKVMLCCGRKKESFEQDFQATQHRSLLDVRRGSAPRTIIGASGKYQKHLYSRSYPESEAVAFGGRPHLQGRDLDWMGRTANGRRQRQQRDCWVRNKFGGHHQEMLQHQHKLHSKISQQIDMGIKSIETFIDYTTVETVEINKRPGQTLGFYIREGNGIDRMDGVFISRIAAGSAVEQNGLLRIGEEILAIDGLSLKGVCLDDVVILMSIPSRLVLTVKTRRSCCKNLSCPSLSLTPTSATRCMENHMQQPQVYISKKSQQKLTDEHLSHGSHISPSGQYLAHSYQPSQLYYKGQKVPKSHIGELVQGYDYHPFYYRFPYPEYDAGQSLLKSFRKDGCKLPGKVIDSAHEPFRRSRIMGVHPDKSILKTRVGEGYDRSYRRPQAESLDRHTNGAVLSRKYHSHDYYSDSEAQLTGEYFSPFVRTYSKDWVYKKDHCQKPPNDEHNKTFQRESDGDDLAGIRELSRSLSRRRKSARHQIEKWRHHREQMDLERKIEEQQKQLYLLQQRLKAELQKQQDLVFTRPVLSYPCHFNLHHDEFKLLQPQEKYVSLFPPFHENHIDSRGMVDTIGEGFISKKHKKLKADKNIEQIFEKEAIPAYRRRYSSDSEILQSGNGKNTVMLTSSPSTKLLASPGLLANGGKCNSLPADIENGSNGDDPTQLKHWLRKLDRLSYDLRDFNHHNNRNKNNNKKDLLDEKQKRKDKKLESDFEKSGFQFEKEEWKNSNIVMKAEAPEFASYTSDEYKSWLSDRRLQSKLHKEKSEIFASRAGTRPISGRDRAKIALSESRQKLAHVHMGHVPLKLDRHKKQDSHTSDMLKKRFTTSASQTTPTIDPDKRKSHGANHGQRAFKASYQPAKIKSKAAENIPTTKEPDVEKSKAKVLLGLHESESHDYQIGVCQPKTDQSFNGASKLPEKISLLSTSGDNIKLKVKNGQHDQLREEPLKIKVEDFHPHCTNEAKIKTDKSGIKSCIYKEFDNLLGRPPIYKAGLYGLMYVKLLCGHGLKSSRRTMLRDLYCVISFDGLNKARTATKTGALNFDWDEDFEIELDDDHSIGFSIYNWDPVAKQKLCFVSKLAISEFLSIYGNHQQLAMKLHPTGTLYIELLYKDLSERFSRVPVPSEDAIFGVDLDETVSRERDRNITNVAEEVIDSEVVQIGSRVPRIVRACIREVELRGLDCVGIYRLCGSYDRLQRLKKELEMGDFNEDLLSVDNVPDVNVIANVLKTFFQELPEPLLTSDLHQLFIDAINVQIEADPDGNASLMLSILDCLPKNSLAVFSFLMDHLKRIVQHRQFNKMNSIAIGRIFGPLLLCPPISNNRQHTQNSKRYCNSASVDLCKQAQVITYLLDIWPSK